MIAQFPYFLRHGYAFLVQRIPPREPSLGGVIN